MTFRLSPGAALALSLCASLSAPLTVQAQSQPEPAASSAAPAAPTAAAPLTYPATRKVEQSDNYHGTIVQDPYRWLEDDNSPETKAWVMAQNAVTDRFLQSMPQRLPARKLYTDVRLYGEHGIPAAIYGAGPRTVLESHAKRADERLALDDLRRATQVVARTLYDLLKVSPE